MASESRQAREEPEPLRPEEQAGREFMAGWFDGVCSGRVSTLHHLCQDLERFALTLNEAGEIHSLTPGAPRTLLTNPHIDKPQHDPNYERGWERGFEQITYLLLKRTARNLPKHGLSLVSKQGHPVSLEEMEEGWADLYTVGIAANRPTRLPNQSLHASLDRALQEASASTGAFPLEAASLAEHPKSSLLLKMKGVLTMIHKHIDRRAAIISLSTVLACGALGYAFWPKAATAPATRSRTTPSYVMPPWLRQMPANTRAFFLAWDKAFWKVETQTPAPPAPTSVTQPFNAMATLLLTSMSVAGDNQLKGTLAGYLAASNRAAYIPFMIPGLDSGVSDAAARTAISEALRILAHRSGVNAFNTPAIHSALLTFYNAEQDPGVQKNLDKLLTALGVAH